MSKVLISGLVIIFARAEGLKPIVQEAQKHFLRDRNAHFIINIHNNEHKITVIFKLTQKVSQHYVSIQKR